MNKKITSLKTLIEIREGELERLQSHRAQLEHQMQIAVAQLDYLGKELKKEQEVAGNEPSMLMHLAEYAKENKRKRDGFKAAKMRAEQQIEQVSDVIQQVFGELKKLEIAKTRFEAMEEAKRKLEEQKFMDELGSQGHRRRMENII